VAGKIGLPVQQIRIWSMNIRQNQTLRPDVALESDLDNIVLNSLIVLRMVQRTTNNAELYFYVETQTNPIGIFNNEQYFFKGKMFEGYTGILLFIKYYDPITQTLEFIDTLSVEANTDKISSYVPHLLKMMRIPQETHIDLYEEVKPEMVELLDVNQTFEQAELTNGDILSFQIPAYYYFDF
jgi:ubiquitin carboxyl-terminal hydrolase 7